MPPIRFTENNGDPDDADDNNDANDDGLVLFVHYLVNNLQTIELDDHNKHKQLTKQTNIQQPKPVPIRTAEFC